MLIPCFSSCFHVFACLSETKGRIQRDKYGNKIGLKNTTQNVTILNEVQKQYPFDIIWLKKCHYKVL